MDTNVKSGPQRVFERAAELRDKHLGYLWEKRLIAVPAVFGFAALMAVLPPPSEVIKLFNGGAETSVEDKPTVELVEPAR